MPHLFFAHELISLALQDLIVRHKIRHSESAFFRWSYFVLESIQIKIKVSKQGPSVLYDIKGM